MRSSPIQMAKIHTATLNIFAMYSEAMVIRRR